MAMRLATVMLSTMRMYIMTSQYSVMGWKTFVRITARVKAAAPFEMTLR